MLLDYQPLVYSQNLPAIMACVDISDTDTCGSGESSNGVNEYGIRNIIRMSAFFHAMDGTALDPTDVTLYFKTPDGIITDVSYPGSIIRDSAGHYHYDVLITQPGNNYYEFEGRGNLIATAEGQFLAKPSVFPE